MATATRTAQAIAEAKASPDEFTSEHLDAALQLAAERLPPKRKAFIDAFVSNGFCGADAYRAANYKVKNGNVARTESSRILSNPNAQSYLMWKLRQITVRDDTQVDEGRLIRESNALAYASITDVISWDSEGRVTVKASDDMPREVAAAVKKIKSTTKVVAVEDGPDIETTTVEIEMHDKKGAMDLQARIAGMLRDVKTADHSHYKLIMNFGPPPEEKDVSATNHSINCQQSRSTLGG